MTGEELLNALAQIPFSQLQKPVHIEGDVSWGWAEKVWFDESDNTISITRLP